MGQNLGSGRPIWNPPSILKPIDTSPFRLPILASHHCSILLTLASFYPKPLLSEAEITRGCSNNGSHGCSSELNDRSFPLLQLFLRPALFPHHVPLSSSGMHFSLHSLLFSQFLFSIQVSILPTSRAFFPPITKWVFLFLTIHENSFLVLHCKYDDIIICKSLFIHWNDYVFWL